MPEWTWQTLEASVIVTGEKTVCTPEDCQRVARDLDLTCLPPSYCEYVRRFGAGEWGFGLFIAVPFHPWVTATLRYKVDSYKDALSNFLTPPDFGTSEEPYEKIRKEWRQDFDCETLQRLLCFGGFGNGYDVCWDPAKRHENNEMDICVVTHEETKIVYSGANILDFLGTYIIDGKLDNICPLEHEKWLGDFSRNGISFSAISGKDAPTTA